LNADRCVGLDGPAPPLGAQNEIGVPKPTH